MKQTKEAIFELLLTREGVKSTNEDFKRLPKYYGFSIENMTVFCEHVEGLKLPDEWADNVQGIWSVYLGDPEGCGRHYFIRKMLQDEHFREYLEYPQLLEKKYRHEQVENMESELKDTEDEIFGLYEHFNN